jgi:tRNA(His) guanylyltransferase
LFKKGSVIFRDVSRPSCNRNCTRIRLLISAKYELVDPARHRTAEAMDALAEPVQQSKTQTENDKKRRAKARILVAHLDIIKDEFWERRPWILSNKPGKVPKEP